MTDAATLIEAVSEAIVLLSNEPPASRERIVALGASKGLTKVEINYLASLLPSAFAQEYYRDADIYFSQTFAIIFQDGTRVERYFQDVPLYRVAQQMAANTPREKLLPLASRSAEHGTIVAQGGPDKAAASTIQIAIKNDFDLPAKAYG